MNLCGAQNDSLCWSFVEAQLFHCPPLWPSQHAQALNSVNLCGAQNDSLCWSFVEAQLFHCPPLWPSQHAQALVNNNETSILLVLLMVLFILVGTTRLLLTFLHGMPPGITALPLGGQSAPTISAASSPPTCSQQKRHRSVSDDKDTSNGGGGGEGGDSKRRKTLYHPTIEQCLPCVLWLQSGSDPNLRNFHPLKDSRHVGSNTAPLSHYASYDGTIFQLAYDDCICKPCHADFTRKLNKENRGIPRWARVKRQFYSTNTQPNQHCIYCCEGECTCASIHQWGPEEWHGENTTIATWKKFLALTGKVDHIIPDHANHICRVHYRGILKLKEAQFCCICNSKNTTSWNLVCDIAPTPQHIEQTFHVQLGSAEYFTWVCDQCTACYRDDTRLEQLLRNDQESSDPFKAQKSKLLLSALETLERDGVVFTKDILAEYKTVLNKLSIPKTDHNRLGNTLVKYLTILSQRRLFKTYNPPNYSSGKGIYDERKFTPHSLEYIFRQRELWQKSVKIEHLQELIRNQTDLFPSSKNFDFTCLISKESSQIDLDAYFDPELFEIIDRITQSKASAKKFTSNAYKHLRKTRIQMIIGILCLAMNPLCCFLQTLNGLLCYAYGLRDKGFKALNSLGCCCGIDHIRSHGAFWASQKKCTDMLDGTQPWKLTIDNLNFHMKFAKSLPESANGSSKMLNLLTAQVSHSTSADLVSDSTLKGAVFKSMTKSVHSHIKPIQRTSVDIQHFSVQNGTPESYFYQHFLGVCYECTLRGLAMPPVKQSSTFLEAVQSMMPHWTPQSKDNVVYATIEEASSASLKDVQAYLSKVKQDLKIGHSGSPVKIPIAGDQQTFALMKKLQKEQPSQYAWMTILHGDWHMLQLLSEILRDILWDGGLKQMCARCGYKKIPTQWQETHLFLLALYQASLRKALLVYNQEHDANSNNSKNFWSWLTKVASDCNKDEMSKFWAKMLSFLSGYVGYFVAIRSGNWVLRNSAIKVVIPLLFSYNHYKYENLATEAIVDGLTLPADLLSLFLKGGWTISVKGKPHHNLALDEAHESIINLRLKTITARPSHFRTVELANFMSYLDAIVKGLEGRLYAYRQREPVHYRKRYVCQRATKIDEQLKDVVLYIESEEERPLKNLLSTNSTLDSQSADDLLNIERVGTQRMKDYVQEHYLKSSAAENRKKSKRPRKLATFSSRPSSTREGKKRESELTTIAKNAMELLQANGITAQTSPYPLAISDIDGNLRSSGKSKFLSTLTKCLNFERALSTTFPSTDCTVIDMLYFVHMPPPLSVNTFLEYFEHLWSLTVRKYAIQKGAAHIYLVFDKPDYLPPPRSIVHKSRGKKNQHNSLDPVIEDAASIPHSNSYSSLLTNSASFKKGLLKYITEHYREKSKSVTSKYSLSVTIDSPSLSSPVTIHSGQSVDGPPNEHGEADYAVWHYCIHEQSATILIVSSDTDTWVYGLGLCELGYLQGKIITVQRGNTDSFISINMATAILTQQEKLNHFTFPVLTLVALYILTGCDYVSAFYRCTKTNFLETLIKDGQFVCPNGNLLKTINGEFQCIHEASWIKLVTAVYYNKFHKFFRSKAIEHTYDLIIRHQDAPEAKRMLSAIHFQGTARSDLASWHDFMRRVTYHVPTVTKYHEFRLLPSYQALVLHCKRANYVMKLALSAPLTSSPFLPCFTQFGWHVDSSETVCVTWDCELQEDDSSEEEDSSQSDASEATETSEDSD